MAFNSYTCLLRGCFTVLSPSCIGLHHCHADGNISCLPGSTVELLFPRGGWIQVGFVPSQQQLLFLSPRLMLSQDSCFAQRHLMSPGEVQAEEPSSGSRFTVLLAPLGSKFVSVGRGQNAFIHSIIRFASLKLKYSWHLLVSVVIQ